MPLSLNEIRERARAFAREWATETSERAEAQSFWNAFFHVFGVQRRRVAVFEQKAARFSGSQHGRIDVFWPGVLLAEHKSAGRDLEAAFAQATDYFAGISDAELPRHVLVSDFQRFVLHDLETRERVEFTLAELPKEIGRFGFISGYQTRSYKEEDPVNVQAAERMGRLHDALKAAGFDGHALEVLLVRLLFCLFADDTGIFPRQGFHELISQRTREDGSDLGMWIGRIFQVLSTAPEKRQTTLDEQLAELPYVNGKLFDELLPLADFNAAMRGLLLEASQLDWSRISPAIFGSMFQSVMDAKARRNLGAHYTSEKNILKLIGPLFLDGLKAELDKAGHDEKKLAQLHRKLATLKFLDPACGCGNFLVIAYREIRLLELQVLERQFARQQSVLAHVQDHVLVDVDQFYGIEIEEFPAQIAQVALWLMDHQMNLRVAEQFGENVLRLPLKKSATIVHGNALRIDWNDVVPASGLDFILGNPPFVGHHLQSQQQKAEMLAAIGDAKAAGVLDFVCAWYLKAAHYITAVRGEPAEPRAASRESVHGSTGSPRTDSIRCAFVSTNSITQGEQVGILWRALSRFPDLSITFAHRTFKWSNEARGKAAVYCVIIGFANTASHGGTIFEYERVDGEPHAIEASQINPYLVDAPWVALENRSTNLCGMPEMMYGSKPTDDGNFLFTDAEKVAFLAEQPDAAAFVKPFISAHEFLHGEKRWVLWLVDADPAVLKKLPKVMERVNAVDRFRKASKAASTRAYPYPTLFRQVTQPKSDYVLIPRHSSENRRFIPMGFFAKESIVADSCNSIPNATLFHFGVLNSQMHMAWVRTTCGRLKSDFRYSKDIVYNNFPWPELAVPIDGESTPVRGEPVEPRTSHAESVHGSTSSPRTVSGNTPRTDSGNTPRTDSGKTPRTDSSNAPATALQRTIATAAQVVLDARAQFPDATLADLYDPLTMPPSLVKAHAALDKAVDAAYLAAEKTAGRKPPKLSTDAERVAFLFQRYQALTSLLPVAKEKKTRKKSGATR